MTLSVFTVAQNPSNDQERQPGRKLGFQGERGRLTGRRSARIQTFEDVTDGNDQGWNARPMATSWQCFMADEEDVEGLHEAVLNNRFTK